jgi:hypothetical protein
MICEVPLDPAVPWQRKHLASLRHLYAKAAPAAEILDGLEAALPQHASRITDASTATIRFLAERLRIATPILVSSELGLEARFQARFPEGGGPTLRIVAYLEALGATELIEGASGRDYFDVPLFERHGMRVHFQSYEHPRYPQLHGDFISHLSAIDLLLCEGEDGAQRVLRAAARPLAS